MKSLLRLVAAGVLLVLARGAMASDGVSVRVAPTVDVQDEVSGQLVAGAGSARIDARVGGDAMIVAGRVHIDATIEGDIIAAAGAFTLSSQGQIGGNLRLAAGDAVISGAVGGDVVIATGSITIDGHVGGDVRAISGKVVVLPGAVIGGSIRARGLGSLEVSPDAQVLGGTSGEPEPQPKRESRVPHNAISGALLFGILNLAFIGLFTLGIGLVFLALFPGVAEAAVTTVRVRTGATLLTGFLIAIAVPFAVLLLVVTLLGIPFAILAVLGYLLLLALAYGVGSLAFAAAIWRRLRVGSGAMSLPAAFWGRALCLFMGLLLVGFLRHLPLVGAMVVLATVFLGIGGVSIESWRRWRA